MTNEKDYLFMKESNILAKKCNAKDGIKPNVGAVAVRDNKIIATSYRGETEVGNHAEFILLEKKLANEDLSDVTIYTTLEPCTKRNHPKISCTQRLINRNVKRIVIGQLDPNPDIRGKGFLILRREGAIVDMFPHELGTELDEINKEFLSLHSHSINTESFNNQKLTYSSHIESIVDVSHIGAKRYSAIIIVEKDCSKDFIKSIIRIATNEIKNKEIYKNENIKRRWENNPAHVVWLFIAHDINDVQDSNWICRSFWVDPKLDETMKPIGLEGNDSIDDIKISWEEVYQSRKEYYNSRRTTKWEFIELTKTNFKEVNEIAEKVIKLYEEFNSGMITEFDLIEMMKTMESEVQKIYFRLDDNPIPPFDCDKYDLTFQQLFITFQNMFIYYSKNGLQKWPESNRKWLMSNSIKEFINYREEFILEESKLTNGII